MSNNNPAIAEARRNLSKEIDATCSFLSVQRKVKLPLISNEGPRETSAGKLPLPGENKSADDDQTALRKRTGSRSPGKVAASDAAVSRQSNQPSGGRVRSPKSVQTEAEGQQSAKKRRGLAGRALRWIRGLFVRR